MFASSPIFFLALALLAGPALATPCLTVRHIELPVVSGKDVEPVCISPGKTTVFSFDADLMPESVSVEEHGSFTKVEPGASTLKLVPSESVPLGKPLRLRVRFSANTAPSSVSLVLVAHAGEAASLVEVHLRKRTAASYTQELKAKEAEIRHLREELARLRTDDMDDLVGLRSLLATDILGMGGVEARITPRHLPASATNAISVVSIRAYSAFKRVALVVELMNAQGAPPWRAEGATLTLDGKSGVRLKLLPLWQNGPLGSGDTQRVVVEAEAGGEDVSGTFTLKLWGKGGTRVVTVPAITFP